MNDKTPKNKPLEVEIKKDNISVVLYFGLAGLTKVKGYPFLSDFCFFTRSDHLPELANLACPAQELI